MGQKVTFRFWW